MRSNLYSKFMIVFIMLLFTASNTIYAGSILNKTSFKRKGMLNFDRGNINKKLRILIGSGINYPLKGYSNYKNNLLYSVLFDILKEKDFERQKIGYRIRADWFYLSLPDDVLYTTEDVLDLSFSCLYGLSKKRAALYPYLEIGAGLYVDWVRIESPVRKSSNMYLHMGVAGGFGLEFQIMKKLLLIPQLTWHYIIPSRSSNIGFTVNMGLDSKKSVKKYNRTRNRNRRRRRK